MDAPIIAVVDYHKGNLSSVARGLARAGAEALVTDDPERIRTADGIVLPGVGSFYDAITFMRDHGQDTAVIDAVAGGEGTPFLGICLGLQLLFERGDEGVPASGKTEGASLPSDGDASLAPTAADSVSKGARLAPGTVFSASERRWVSGLGVLAGSCTILPARRLKVPHVGWDQVHLTERGRICPLLAGFAEGSNVYFTHSFALDDDVEPQEVAAVTHYGRNFGSVVWRGNLYGCQFHPEKSSNHGHEILRNFVSIASRARGAHA